MKPQDVVVFEEELSGIAAWKWVFFRAWEIDALALGDGCSWGFLKCPGTLKNVNHTIKI
ncbi:hypothetical protein LK537_06570 [Lachnoclostridium pacaense]|uniref:hypothetical protein n=1 Tax=Enterocloster hominis (ex Hitch et al. 2024) TaxID=1917870 RepID=UPI001D127B83|nr:hypothetical protein [Lachnoclostridium pacaense]MCC2816955.1 hypothetical protein [Lachnoclostridium pacaense]